ncbi:hypothetical protein HUT18_07680 [Streptomyces sp. NA04227]|uniref:hypothetical protein n=1 Tax=Streptomyces sp. NA04227 TaxID=2742136 RepID=UPI001590E2C1|nr:hypothetical protein [Streptomyces sp. NA04227]QKW06301.1 hypothetical protein HUT18_07680 [Streptomyces sp. NA04227]
MDTPVRSSEGFSRSEATRLLCAGAYLDAEFRRRVVEELSEHEERPVAPSLGVDVVPVLAHALRARAQEVGTALLTLAIWVLFVTVEITQGTSRLMGFPAFAVYAAVALALYAGRGAAGLSTAVYTLDTATLREAVRGRRKVLSYGPRFLALGYWFLVFYALVAGLNVWPAVIFPLLLVLPVWIHRARVAAVLREELSRSAFARLARAVPRGAERLRRIQANIDREQHAPLTIYDPLRPFIGAGKPYEPWSLALELKRSGGGTDAGRLTARAVIDLIRPRIEALRDAAARTSRDRLCELEIDEFVYLPVGPPRFRVGYDEGTVAAHLREAVDEGGEARRHFLRIRIGAWDENLVVSVLVRVHTQGGMLVLEVVPHVLTPMRPEFRAVDVIVNRGAENVAREGVRALLTAPTATIAAAVSALGTLVSVFRVWLGEPQRALPDGPAASVRELGSVREISLFQEMDVSRYVKTVQDRIASGVHSALSAAGYETGEFEQQIVNVSGGGVFIGSMSGGAVATGERATARSSSTVLEKGGGAGS